MSKTPWRTEISNITYSTLIYIIEKAVNCNINMIGVDFMDKDFNNIPPFMDFSMMQQMRSDLHLI